MLNVQEGKRCIDRTGITSLVKVWFTCLASDCAEWPAWLSVCWLTPRLLCQDWLMIDGFDRSIHYRIYGNNHGTARPLSHSPKVCGESHSHNLNHSSCVIASYFLHAHHQRTANRSSLSVFHHPEILLLLILCPDLTVSSEARATDSCDRRRLCPCCLQDFACRY